MPERINRQRPGEVLSFLGKHPGIHHSIDDIMQGLKYNESEKKRHWTSSI